MLGHQLKSEANSTPLDELVRHLRRLYLKTQLAAFIAHGRVISNDRSTLVLRWRRRGRTLHLVLRWTGRGTQSWELVRLGISAGPSTIIVPWPWGLPLEEQRLKLMEECLHQWPI